MEIESDCSQEKSKSILYQPEDYFSAKEVKKKKFRYVYDFIFFDLTSVYFIMDLQTFRKIHLSVCRYMNACLKEQLLTLDYFVDNDLRRSMRLVIVKLKILLKTMNKIENREAFRFWKVKRVQIAKTILDCEDGKIDFFSCARDVEKILNNGLCYASSKEKNSDKMYSLCLLFKVIYTISFLDYDVNRKVS